MPVGDKQKLITEIVSTVLQEPAQTKVSFPWFVNKHLENDFGIQFPIISNVFKCLNGNIETNHSKRTLSLDCDAYFGGRYNFIFEFDEFQHFSSYRLKSLNCYPENLDTAFDIKQYKLLCSVHREKADNYRRAKMTVDFNFIGGRTAQRAYLDCFRDLLPLTNGLNPTLRITEFEVANVYRNDENAQKIVSDLIKKKLLDKRL
jgi:hypothetical protein